MELATKEAAPGGDALYDGETQVGLVTCGMYSRLTERSMAIARLDPAYAVAGRKLQLRGTTLSCAATTHTLPFDDPDKVKRTAKG